MAGDGDVGLDSGGCGGDDVAARRV
ncbi:hypothetical protein Tco_0961001, partial [Tanacetum coccineum]